MAEFAECKVLVVGCGDLGMAVAERLLESGIATTGLKRAVQKIASVQMLQADVTQPDSLTVLHTLQPQVIIYCVAAGGQSDDAYQSAYVDGLRNTLATQANNHLLQHVFFVSSTRVYGQVTDDLLDESVEAIPADFGGKRLLEAEQLLRSLRCNGTVLRLSGIYGPGRLRMVRLAESPAIWPAPNTWSNRIHRDDAAVFIAFLVKQALAGVSLDTCYIVTDSQPVTQHEVLRWLAASLGINMHDELLPAEGGKRLSNNRMRATGFKLAYPDYRSGYASLLSNGHAE